MVFCAACTHIVFRLSPSLKIGQNFNLLYHTRKGGSIFFGEFQYLQGKIRLSAIANRRVVVDTLGVNGNVRYGNIAQGRVVRTSGRFHRSDGV